MTAAESGAARVERGIGDFIERHRPDELLLTANVFDHTARVRSFEIAASGRDALHSRSRHVRSATIPTFATASHRSRPCPC